MGGSVCVVVTQTARRSVFLWSEENLNVLVRVWNGVIDAAWRFFASRDVGGWINVEASSAKC